MDRIHGLIVLDKPRGITSRQAVDEVKRLFGVRKAGHAGTLDPDATGVLIICLGRRATRLFDRLVEGSKEYIGTMILGVETDTQDASGRVIRRCEVNATEEEIREVFSKFVGEIEQVPPMFSALRVKGKRLYELARRGEVVERKPRRVRIYELEVLKVDPPRVEFRVVCSKGTYIRTLAADIGRELGCGAHLAELRRTRVGPFTIGIAVPLDALKSDPEGAFKYLIPVERVLKMLEEGDEVASGRRPAGHASSG